MQSYELLYIIPGTSTEDEAKPIHAKVQEVVAAAGVKDAVMEHGGKNRLSYPIRHIRYGWFELVYFQAEPAIVSALESKLRLLPDMLRVVIRQESAGAIRHLQNAFVPITRDQGRFDHDRREAFAPAMASATVRPSEAAAASTQPVETKVESGQLEDITKKLDEILEKDIANT